MKDQPEAPVALHIYAGQDGSFELYEDEGDNYHYEDGAFSTINISWHDVERQLTLDARKGQYAEMPELRIFEIFLHEDGPFPTGFDSAGQKQTVVFSGQKITVEM